MLSLEEALERILSAIRPLPAENVPLAEAHGRFLTCDFSSPISLPPFDNSAMDGYAVVAGDLANASAESPVPLACLGEIAAGGERTGRIQSGQCVRVFTGSMLPDGADAVVMQEDVRPLAGGRIEVLDRVTPWENVRFQGEDIKAGARLASRGDRITLGLLTVMAATGEELIEVSRRPKVALLATGNELRQAGQVLGPGQIYESNRLPLARRVARAGGEASLFPLVPDDLKATENALRDAFDQNDVVISSGGVSVGDHDHVKPALENLGVRIEFWKVAMRPGKPFVHASLSGKHFFGLPGNPVSAMVTFLMLVHPALIQFQGGTVRTLPAAMGTLTGELVNRGDRRHFARVLLTEDGRVQQAGLQSSHGFSSLAQGNGLVDVPPRTTLPSGTAVRVIRLEE